MSHTLENILIIINVSANLLTSVSIIYLISHVYNNRRLRDANPMVDSIWLRLCLTLISCGALLKTYLVNVVNLGNVLFSVGILIMFIWISIFHVKVIFKKYDIQ